MFYVKVVSGAIISKQTTLLLTEIGGFIVRKQNVIGTIGVILEFIENGIAGYSGSIIQVKVKTEFEQIGFAIALS